MKSLSLDETYYYETCETYENHETFKITKLMKPWNVETMIPLTSAVVQAVLSPVWAAWNIENQETFQITKSWNHETSKL